MIISSKKYACETCIKGHRSSACRHTDRPLFEIKKKGRPVTQCEHCRELRKTKQVHVKCICETNRPEPPSKHGSRPDFESAAFPNGLPESLGASVAFPVGPEVHSSDSEHGGGHRCKQGEPCPCISPMNKNRKKGGPVQDTRLPPGPPMGAASIPSSSQRTSSQILARIAELRPVLPRPLQTDPSALPSGSLHGPPYGAPHANLSRHHDTAFSPYERAYGMTHQNAAQPQSYAPPLASQNSPYCFNQSFAQQHPMALQSTSPSWPAGSGNPTVEPGNFPSLCGCGDNCQCPGCTQHNHAISHPPSSAYLTCTNPEACLSCLDCTILSLPPSATLPLDPSLSIYDNPTAVDEWLRQLTSDASLEQYDNMPVDQYASLQSWPGDASLQSRDASSSIPSFMAQSRSPSSMMGVPDASIPYFPDRSSRTRASLDPLLIDPRLLPEPSMQQHHRSLSSYSAGSNRSRSASSSSQSSHQGSQDQHHTLSPPYRPSGRVQGLFTPDPLASGGSSSSRLQVRPGQSRGGTSRNSPSSLSPSPVPSPSDRTGSTSDPSLNNLRIF